MAYVSDEDRREWLRQAVINDVRMLIGRREELKNISDTAQGVWDALLKSETWHMTRGPAPSKDWVEPEEIWRMTPEVKTKTRAESDKT